MINMKLSKTQIHKVPKSEKLECTSEQNIKGITLLTSSEDANSVEQDLNISFKLQLWSRPI